MRHTLNALAIVALALLVGCNGTQKRDPDPGTRPPKGGEKGKATLSLPIEPIDRETLPAVPGSEYWAKVKAGKLKVGILIDRAPFSVKVGERYEGFDVTLARSLGQTLGVEVELVPLAFAELFPALYASPPKIDLIIANMTRTARRAAVVNFSDPYLKVSQGALVERRLLSGTREGAEIQEKSVEDYLGLATINGLIIGVSAGSVPETYARQLLPKATVKSYPSLAEALEALRKGQVQAVGHDVPSLRVWIEQNGSLAYRFTSLFGKVTEDDICVAMRKGDLEFLQWLNAYIHELEARGTLEAWQQQFIFDLAWTGE